MESTTKTGRLVDAQDSIIKVEQVLDFLTAEMKNPGLCHVLSGCQEELHRVNRWLTTVKDYAENEKVYPISLERNDESE